LAGRRQRPEKGRFGSSKAEFNNQALESRRARRKGVCRGCRECGASDPADRSLMRLLAVR
jgi:hypothetical protein